MNATDPPTLTTLLDWLEGRLDVDASRRVAAQVAEADEQTTETLEWAREFLAASRLMPLAAPPAELSDRLRQAFGSYHTPAAAGGHDEARLAHDSRAGRTAAGLRSGTAGDLAQLTYASDALLLALEVARRGAGEVNLRGRVAPNGSADARADLAFLAEGTLSRALRTGADGRFEATGLDERVDELWVTLAETRVRVPLDLRV